MAHTNLLECYYRKQDQLEFEKQLERISKNQRFNFQAASVSAFVSQQLGTRNSYKFCDNPVDLVTVYDLLDTNDMSPNLITEIETTVENNKGNERFAPGHISLGFKSIGNLFAERTPFAVTLEQVIRRYVGKFLQKHNNGQNQIFRNWPAEYALDGWYIKMLSGGDITAHVHQGWLSGTFYVRVPAKRENDAGNIEFTLHAWDLPVVRDDFPRRIVATKPGRLVLFPSSLPHRVLPFSEGQDRISIAFDIVPKSNQIVPPQA